MTTLVISWRPFLILRFKKIPQGLETYIFRDIITRMLEMHNQLRKKRIAAKTRLTPPPPWVSDCYFKSISTHVI